MATADLLGFVGLVLAAFLPPLFFAVKLRSSERHRPEPWQGLAKAFLWGAFGATLLAILLEAFLFPLIPGAGDSEPLMPEENAAAAFGSALVAAVVLAPIVEESVKALGMRFVRDEDPEPEDGAIYGGMMGLGFAGTETAFYIALAFGLGGLPAAVTTALVRGIATVSLHGAATAISGHGYWMAKHGGRAGAFASALLLAMLFHGGYNLLASIDRVWALFAALGVALWTWVWVRRRIRRLDARTAF